MSKRKKVTHTPLPQIIERFDGGGVKARFSFDEIGADFNNEPEAMVERGKTERIFRLIAREHLKAAVAAVRMLCVAIIQGKHDDGISGLKGYLGVLGMAVNTLDEQRHHLLKPAVLVTRQMPEEPSDA